MGCGASSLRRPTVDARGGGESYVHLKHLEKSVALSGKVATRLIPHRKEYAAPVRGDGDDATEVADTRSSYLNSSHGGESVSATQHLLRFLTSKGESESSADRPLSSLGNLDELSKAMLSVNAGTNQVGALRVQLRTNDPNARDSDGDRVPLHWAAARGHARCAMVLLRAGADPQQIELSSGLTCSELADERGHTELAITLRGFAPPLRSLPASRRCVDVEEEPPAAVLAAEETAPPAAEVPAPEATTPVEPAAAPPAGGQAAMWLALEAAARQGQPARMDWGGGRGAGRGGRGAGGGHGGRGLGGGARGVHPPDTRPRRPAPPPTCGARRGGARGATRRCGSRWRRRSGGTRRRRRRGEGSRPRAQAPRARRTTRCGGRGRRRNEGSRSSWEARLHQYRPRNRQGGIGAAGTPTRGHTTMC